MANIDTSNSWEKIQKGVKETERLIGQKQYNLAMVKARQTLEYMVRCLGEKACIVDGDLSSTIDELYLGKWITKTTSEHYHKIRILGNKAIHEGSDNAYDANQAYHLLSQEVYTFSNDYRSKNRRRPPSNTNSRNSKSRKRSSKKSGFTISQQGILKLVILVLCIAFIAAVIKFIKPGKDDEKPTTEAPTTIEQTEPATTAPTESVPPETLAREIYKTNDTLNVRKEPSTSSEKLGVLSSGQEVTYKGAYDDEWAIIEYNGQDAYVASQYLTKE